MKVDIKVNPRRSAGDDLLPFYVVIGDGKYAGSIQTVYIHSNVECEILTSVWAANGRQRKMLRSIDVNPDLKDRGWRLLKEVYEEEDRERDWVTFLDFQDACRAGKVRVKPTKVGENIKYMDAVPGFPNRLLPQYCQDLWSGAKAERELWSAPSEDELAESPPAKRGKRTGASGEGDQLRDRKMSQPAKRSG